MTLIEQVGHLAPLIAIQSLLFLRAVIRTPVASMLDLVRTVLLWISYALMVPVIRHVFFFVGVNKLYFIAGLFALFYLLLYNYNYHLVREVSSNNIFNIDKANICVTYLSFLFMRNLEVDKAVLLLIASNV